jgi:predicted nucleic acid-binding protein
VRIDNHFIDTNIVLGATIDWDSQSKPVTIYLDKYDPSTRVYASDKVFNEVLRVVYKQRQLAKRTARIVFDEFEDENRAGRQDLIDFIYASLVDDVR